MPVVVGFSVDEVALLSVEGATAAEVVGGAAEVVVGAAEVVVGAWTDGPHKERGGFQRTDQRELISSKHH